MEELIKQAYGNIFEEALIKEIAEVSTLIDLRKATGLLKLGNI